MLACRLCFYSFGVQDPEQWLENCPPRVMNIWRAFAVADGWATQRRLDALTPIALKRLLALKFDKDARQEALASLDELANNYLPADYQVEKQPDQPMSENVLLMMNRGGGSVPKTPTKTIQIELDPWQRQ